MVEPLKSHQKRPINSDFEDLITQERRDTHEPAQIKFRNEHNEGIRRSIWRIPIECLRFRKDNGRIAAEIMRRRALSWMNPPMKRRKLFVHFSRIKVLRQLRS